MIKFKKVSITRRYDVLKNSNFEFLNGNIYGIFAPNGTGKTTIFEAIMDLISYQGMIVSEVIDKENYFYFEDNSWLDGNLSGMEYFKLVKDLWHSSIEISEIIEKMGLQEFIDIPIRKYSLGMKQKIIIGMYFISDAKVLIMDEITNGLDEDSRNLFFKELMKIKQNKLVLISSHYNEDIKDLVDVKVSLKNYELVEETE